MGEEIINHVLIRNVYLEDTLIPVTPKNFDYAVQMAYEGPPNPDIG